MHDVAKSTTVEQKRKGPRRWIRPVLYTLGAVLAIVGLVFSKMAMMLMVLTVISGLVILLGWIAFRRFRAGGTTSGAVFAVLAIFLLLVDIKAFQFRAMAAAGAKMAPPPTTVTSAVVKEEDWAPVLSAIGSVSAVQGAVVSAEFSGIVAEVHFENGGVAKKGDVLMRLATYAEAAQLHSAEADLELARQDLQRTRDLAARKVVSKSELDAGESK